MDLSPFTYFPGVLITGLRGVLGGFRCRLPCIGLRTMQCCVYSITQFFAGFEMRHMFA